MSYLYILILLISCSSNTEDLKVFKYNLINHPNSLDPAFSKDKSSSWICSHIFSTLITLDEAGNIRPKAAKRWEISEDGLNYSFIIDSQYRFHEHPSFQDSTRSINAHDFVYSFSRIVDKEVNSPGRWIFDGKISDKKPFVAINDSTFQINLKQAFRPMLSLLSMPYCSVIPKEVVEANGVKWKETPIGTGPFKFKKWVRNQNIFLTPNKNYPTEIGNLDGIKIHFISDRKIAFLELLNGTLDYVNGLESSFINEMLTKDGQLQQKHVGNIQFQRTPYLNTEYIGINLDILSSDNPLFNKDFRKALNYGINKELLLKTLRNGIGFPANNGFTPPGLGKYLEDLQGFNYDLTKAKELIESSGIAVENMKPLVLKTNQDYQDIMLFVSKQWELLGVKSKVELMESSVLREGMRNGNIEMFRASWIGDYPDPENFMSLFYGENNAPPNYTRFSNTNLDQLYNESNVENRDSIRNSIFLAMENILLEEAPVILLFYDQSANFISKRVDGLGNNVTNLLNVENLSIKD